MPSGTRGERCSKGILKGWSRDYLIIQGNISGLLDYTWGRWMVLPKGILRRVVLGLLEKTQGASG